MAKENGLIIPAGEARAFTVPKNAGVDERGLIYIRPPLSKRGDHLDLRAEMDVLCAVSACPDDLSVCNNHKAKPLGIEIFGAA